MDIKALKEKIVSGQMSDEELSALLSNNKRKGSFFKDLLKGFIEGYTAPNMWKVTMESLLIFTVIVGVVVLSGIGKMDITITSVLLAAVLGFLFGKIR